MPSRFHQEALQRLSVPYAADPAALRVLTERAAELRIRLPASFVEWYGMRDGVEILRSNSNCDHPIDIRRLGENMPWRWTKEHDWVREGLLLFMVENQAVSVWAIRLDGGDDPPVVVARDPDLEWRPCAASFSTFIGCQIWDHVEIWGEAEPAGSGLLLQAQDVPLGTNDLQFLRDRFEEKPTTHGWPGENQYRFQRGGARLLIWDGDGQADWYMTEETEAGLASLIRELWDCGGLRTSLWSNDELGERVLQSVRR